MTKHKFIPVSEPSITKKEIRYVTDAIRSGWVSSLGPYIDKFEKEFASYVGTKYALTTSSGYHSFIYCTCKLGNWEWR